MTETGKIALGSILGFTIGAATTGFAIHYYDKKKSNELMASSCAEMREHYEKKIQELKNKLDKTIDTLKLNTTVDPELLENIFPEPSAASEESTNGTNVVASTDEKVDTSAITETHSSLDLQVAKPEKVDYNKVKVAFDSPELYPEMEEIRKRIDNSRVLPHLCPADVYFGNDPEYRYYELEYFTKDYVTDEAGIRHDMPILYNRDTERVMTVADMVKYVGVEWKSNFGNEDYGYEDMETVFVINESQKSVFMITQMDTYYKCDILGMDEEDDYDYPEVEP